jgi:hypothetical protein
MVNTAFLSLGQKTSTIDVRISYKIIELFSEGLYSSPNKAIDGAGEDIAWAYARVYQSVIAVYRWSPKIENYNCLCLILACFNLRLT